MAPNHRSEQEKIIRIIYPQLLYEPCKFDYVIHATYTPDLYLGISSVNGRHVYVECKEWIEYTDCKRYESIGNCLPPEAELRFLIYRAQDRTLERLEKTFKVINEYSNLDAWLNECTPLTPQQHETTH